MQISSLWYFHTSSWSLRLPWPPPTIFLLVETSEFFLICPLCTMSWKLSSRFLRANLIYLPSLRITILHCLTFSFSATVVSCILPGFLFLFLVWFGLVGLVWFCFLFLVASSVMVNLFPLTRSYREVDIWILKLHVDLWSHFTSWGQGLLKNIFFQKWESVYNVRNYSLIFHQDTISEHSLTTLFFFF